MKTRKIITISSLLVLSTISMALAASPQRGLKRHHRQLGIEMFADELGLTEEQLSKIQEQQFATKKNSIEQRAKIQIAELELRKLMKDKDADAAEIRNKIKEIGELKTNLHLNRVEGKLALHKVLTNEQFEKLQSLKKAHHKQRMNRRGPNSHHPGQLRNFRGRPNGFGFEEFDLESFGTYGEEIGEEGSEI